jgi:hypothetical protein
MLPQCITHLLLMIVQFCQNPVLTAVIILPTYVILLHLLPFRTPFILNFRPFAYSLECRALNLWGIFKAGNWRLQCQTGVLQFNWIPNGNFWMPHSAALLYNVLVYFIVNHLKSMHDLTFVHLHDAWACRPRFTLWFFFLQSHTLVRKFLLKLKLCQLLYHWLLIYHLTLL